MIARNTRRRFGRARLLLTELLLVPVLWSCHRDRTKLAWTDYVPTDDPARFVQLVKSMNAKKEFPPSDIPLGPQDYPTRASDNAIIKLTIMPQASATDLNGSNNGSIQTDDPSTGKSKGRVMALIVNNDTASLPDLPLAAHTPDSVVVWWVDTRSSSSSWQNWVSHYYLVDTVHTTVQDLPVDGRFMWYQDSTSYAGHHAAAWNKHTGIWQSPPPPPGSTPALIALRNATWVSCGSGCCNGAVR